MNCKTIELDQILQTGNDDNSNIITILKCQICEKISFPPYSNHNYDGYICGNCADVSSETSQKVIFSPIEKISLSRIIVGCPRSQSGCPVRFNYKDALNELPNHIINCQFNIVSCEYCHIQILFTDLNKHIEEICEGKNKQCDTCHVKVDIRFPHNCIQALYMKNEDLYKEIKELTIKVHELKKCKPTRNRKQKKKDKLQRKKKEKMESNTQVKKEDESIEFIDNGLSCLKNCKYKEALTCFHDSLNTSIIKYGDLSKEVANCYFNLGLVFEELSQYNKAYEKYNLCREITEKIEGNETLRNAEILSKIGNIWKLQNDFTNAEVYFKRGLDIRVKICGEESNEAIDSMNQLSKLYYEKGEYEKSLSLLKTCSNIKELKGNYDLGYAETMTIIGDIYFEKCEYILSLLHLEKALIIRSLLLGNDNLETANVLNSIGFVYLYYDRENSLRSLSYFQKALEIKKKISLKEYSSGLSDIAVYYCMIDNQELGLNHYIEGLSILKEIFGENHLEVAKFYSDIGYRIYINSNEYEKALDHLYKGLKIKQELLGNTHILVANCYFYLGYAYMKKEDFEKAIECYNKAVSIRSYLLGENHLETADCYFSLGEVYYELHFLDKCIENINICLEIRLKKLSEVSGEIAECEIMLGNAYKNKKDYKISLNYYQKVEKYYTLNENNGKILVHVYSNMGIIYNQIKMNAISIEYHKKALSLYIKYYGEENVNVVNTYYNIAVCNLEMKKDMTYSIEILSKAIEINKKLYGEMNIENVSLLELLGDFYIESNNVRKAKIIYLEGLEVLNNSNEKQRIAQLAYKLGEIYRDEKKFHRALEYFEMSQNNDFSNNLVKIIQKVKNELKEETI